MDRIIVPTGYMGSGSSAITDLVSEFKDVRNDFKSFEYVFLHCPEGLFDLEDKLLLGNNALRSDEAIRTFESRMKKFYDMKFWWVGNYKEKMSPEFMNITNDFINSLINYRFNSYYYMQEEPNAKIILKLLARKPFKILSRDKSKFKPILRYNDGMKIALPSKEEFYKKSHDYIYKLLEIVSKGNKNIILDQLLLPFNLYRVDNYFDDNLKVIAVERDPRDLYIINKYQWSNINMEVPVPKDPNDFADYYIRMRNAEKRVESNKVLKVKFEDLIYNYDKELKRIMKFLDFKKEDHIRQFNRFNPNISIKNTQLFRDPKYKEEIAIIEKKLKDYLYDFPYKLENDVKDTVEFE